MDCNNKINGMNNFRKPFMADKKNDDRGLTCPFRDDILEVNNMKETIEKMHKQQTEMFNRLFVQNGTNNKVDCLSVQVQKNTSSREKRENESGDERRNKWRRYSFYLTLAGILATNIIMLIKSVL